MIQFLYSAFAVLAGGLTTFVLTAVFAMKKAEIDSINDHIGELRNIETLATEYWLQNATHQKESEMVARLKGAFSASAHFNNVAPRILGYRYEIYAELDTQLYDLATGGQFESASRTSNSSTAIDIISICTEIRALLREARRSIFWTR